MHPDKNPDDPNAGVKFRQLSVIYQILKDKERRQRFALSFRSFSNFSYDEVLVEGIPDWKTPVFYYRKLRKMSNAEIGIILSVVAIVIHFATLWGLAFEKRWTLVRLLRKYLFMDVLAGSIRKPYETTQSLG